MTFVSYPAERLAIASLSSRLTETEQGVRKAVMEAIVRAAGPVRLREVHSALSSASLAAAVESLEAKGVLGLRGDEIVFAYPVSGLPTRHRVQLADGRDFDAMCAVDALGAAFAFAQNASVGSSCSRCGRRIAVAVRGGEAADPDPPGMRVAHVNLNRVSNWAKTS